MPKHSLYGKGGKKLQSSPTPPFGRWDVAKNSPTPPFGHPFQRKGKGSATNI